MSDDAPKVFTFGSSDAPAPKSATAPKPRGRTPATAKKAVAVDDALATMESMYKMLALGATLLRRPLTGAHIASQVDTWQTANRQAFESSPKLTALIAGVGQTSGVVTFIVTNGVAAVGIMSAFRQESAMVAEQRLESSEQEAANTP